MIEKLSAIAGQIYQKVLPVRSRHYLAYVRSFPCIACGTMKRLRDAMHVGPHGVGQKASDLDAVPGCRVCHRELHRIGPVKFQQKYDLDFQLAAQQMQQMYTIVYGRLPGEESARANARRVA